MKKYYLRLSMVVIILSITCSLFGCTFFKKGTETEKKVEKLTEETEQKVKKTEKTTKAKTDAQTDAQIAPQTDVKTDAQTEPAQQPDNKETSSVYEESSLQCSYCGQWFSTIDDGALWNPYDRHMLEERDAHYVETEPASEMVVCPDCGGEFEVGNVFRNHICPGKPQ